MRGFSRSMWNLAFCVAAAQAAATEARGENEFSWNSPVSLALGWTVRPDWTGLGVLCLARVPGVLEVVGLADLRLSQGRRGLCHHQLVIKICLARTPQRFTSNSCFIISGFFKLDLDFLDDVDLNETKAVNYCQTRTLTLENSAKPHVTFNLSHHPDMLSLLRLRLGKCCETHFG